MKLRTIILAMLMLFGVCTSRSLGAVDLSSLSSPTMQTLMDMGNSGVVVGGEEFYNFSYIAGAGSTTASQVQVQPVSDTGSGLQFVANWFAADGTSVSDVISYDVEAVNAWQSIGSIDLFSNGTAPAPVSGTFTTTTLTSQTMQGTPAAGALSTYNDGVTFPLDTTQPDVNYASTTVVPELQLRITDAIFADSTAASSGGSGGVATISVVQNSFGVIPEPSAAGWIFPPAAILVTGVHRCRRHRSGLRTRGQR